MSSITAQAHKCCNGVPEFKDDAPCPTLDQCASCIRAKLKKESSGKDGFDSDNVQLPHQCVSIDSAFAGSLSEDKTQRQDIEGINGETCWLMIQDKFGKMACCDVRISKTPPPVQFVDEFLKDCAPAEATQKHVMLNQGVELCGLPQMLKIFKKHNCTVFPTALDVSNNNPVERHHQTISNAVRTMMTGANLLIEFWPHCLLHAVCVFHSLPSKGQTTSPTEITRTKQEEHWTQLRTFGCRVWMRPPGQ